MSGSSDENSSGARVKTGLTKMKSQENLLNLIKQEYSESDTEQKKEDKATLILEKNSTSKLLSKSVLKKKSRKIHHSNSKNNL